MERAVDAAASRTEHSSDVPPTSDDLLVSCSADKFKDCMRTKRRTQHAEVLIVIVRDRKVGLHLANEIYLDALLLHQVVQQELAGSKEETTTGLWTPFELCLRNRLSLHERGARVAYMVCLSQCFSTLNKFALWPKLCL